MRHPGAQNLSIAVFRRMPNRLSAAVFGLSLLITALVLASVALAEESAPAGPAAPAGFQKFGSKWVLPQEIALKQHLAQLDEIVRRAVPLKRQLQLAAEDNARQWQKQQAASKLIDQIAVTMRRQAVGSEEEQRVQRQIDQLKKANEELKRGVAPERLGGQPHVRSLLETLTLQHQQASLLIVEIEKAAAEIAAAYGKLPPQPDTVPLGPLLRPEKIEHSVRKAEAHLNLAEIPLFLHDQQKRIGVVVNELHPTIVSLAPGDERLIVTSNMAFSAGLRSTGPLEEVTLPGGQKAKAHKAKLACLRLGSVTLREQPVIVLQPADEHRGGFLGMKLLQAWNPAIAESGIALTLDPASRVSTAAR